MKVLFLVFNLFALICRSQSEIAQFWHLSDLHLDFYYNYQASELSKVCPSSSGAKATDPGPWGDYRCDSPWQLINSSIYAMRKIYPEPEFILWTGDDTLHTSDEDLYLGEEKVLETMKNLTDLLKSVFPNTTVYSALGNHDYHPKSQMPIGSSTLLTGAAELWKDWFTDESALETFQKNGYFHIAPNSYPNLAMVVLNTNIWYSNNKAIDVETIADPGEQFQWLEDILLDLRKTNRKAYIIGHIPPGYFELVDYAYWLYPQYNARYIDLVKQYSDVIIGQFFGHHHTDSFRLFYDNNGKAVSTLWIAPGVTPWMTTLPGVENGSNNPGIRLFEFDTVTMVPTDYIQYYLDLKDANKNGNTEWKMEYRASTAFQIEDISPNSMEKLAKNLEKADVNCTECENSLLLQKFAFYNSVSYNAAHCDDICQRNHVCAISQLEADTYDKCVKGSANNLYNSANWICLFLFYVITQAIS